MSYFALASFRESWDLFLLCVLVVPFVYFYRKYEQQRALILAQFASSRGLTFSREDPLDLMNKFELVEPFSRCWSRPISNVMHGDLGDRKVYACDFLQAGGEDVTTGSVAIAELASAVPYLRLRPAKFLGHTAFLVGLHDLALESEEFNRAFNVRTADREIAFDILNPRTMQQLLNSPYRRIEFYGRHVVMFDERLWAADEFSRALDFVCRLAEEIPGYVWQKLNARMQH